MKRKKQKNKPDNNSFNSRSRDIYDVKENLKKLRSGLTSQSAETSSFFFNENFNNHNPSNREDTTSDTLTEEYFANKKGDYISSEIKVLRKDLDDHKSELKEKVQDLSEKKLGKEIFYYFAPGIVAAALLIGGIFYTLSYSPLVNDVSKNRDNIDSNKDKIHDLERQIDKTNSDLERTNDRVEDIRNDIRGK